METILDRVQFLCDCTGTTLYKLEQETGLSKGSIRKWNESSPSCESLYKVASYFGISCETLLGHGKPIEEKISTLHSAKLQKSLDSILQTVLKLENQIRSLESEEN